MTLPIGGSICLSSCKTGSRKFACGAKTSICEIPTINKLFIHTQPAHLQKLRGVELDTADRNVERAHYLQRHLRANPGDGPEAN